MMLQRVKTVNGSETENVPNVHFTKSASIEASSNSTPSKTPSKSSNVEVGRLAAFHPIVSSSLFVSN